MECGCLFFCHSVSFCILECSSQAIEEKSTQGGEGGDAFRPKPPNSKQSGVSVPLHFTCVCFVLWNLHKKNLGAKAIWGDWLLANQ